MEIETLESVRNVLVRFQVLIAASMKVDCLLICCAV